MRWRCLFLLFSLLGAVTTAEAATTRTFDQEFAIPNLPLVKALQRFAVQTRRSLYIPPDLAKSNVTVSLQGRHTLRSGLMALLSGTGFSYEIVSGKAVRIFRIVDQAKPSSTVQERDAFVPLVEDIVITATGHEKWARELPLAASAVSFDEISTPHRLGSRDMAALTPSFQYSRRSPLANKITFRGLSDGPFNGRAQALVSTYLDYDRVTYNAPDPGFYFLDTHRVEILRGPQGSLYGAGALTGLFRIVPHEPDLRETSLELNTSVSATRHGGANHTQAAVTNVPISPGRLALRLSGLYAKVGGFIDNERLDLKNTNKRDTLQARAAVGLKLFEDWRLTLSTDYLRKHADDRDYYLEALGRFQQDKYILEPARDRLFKPTLKINADFGWASIVSTTYYLNRHLSETLDATQLSDDLIDQLVPESRFTTSSRVESISNETHLSSRPGQPVEWVLGTFYAWRESDLTSIITIPGLGSTSQLSPIDTAYLEELNSPSEQVAVFGEIKAPLAGRTELTVGGRYYRTESRANSSLSPPQTNGRVFREAQQDNSGFVPKIALSHWVSDTVMIYAQYAEGFRLGGFKLLALEDITFRDRRGDPSSDLIFPGNEIGTFNDDKLTNYELGAKFATNDGRLVVNLAGYHAKWSDIQSFLFDNLGSPFITNVGDAKIYGLEIDAKGTFGDKTVVKAFLSLNHSSLTNVEEGVDASVGARLPAAPAASGGLSLRHQFAIAGRTAHFGATYNFHSTSNSFFGTTFDAKTDAFHGLEASFDIAFGKLQLSFFARNILASKANLFPANNQFNSAATNGAASSRQVTPPYPREVGFSAGWKF